MLKIYDKDRVARVLIELYRIKKRPFVINRIDIRNIYDHDLRGAAVEEIDDILRQSGYFIYPLDLRDFSKAQVWVVDLIERATKEIPLVKTVMIDRAVEAAGNDDW